MSNIQFEHNEFITPNNPEIGFIIGDGIGIDVTPVAMKVIDAAVEKAYHGEKKIQWKEIIVGEKAAEHGLDNLSEEALQEIKNLRVVLKGPLTTPVGSGFRSLNVAIRQKLNLYACVRPVKWIPGVPAPVKNPEKLDVVIFRENTEDVYAGIEFEKDSSDVKDVINFLKNKGKIINEDSGVGIKPVSEAASKRLVRSAINYAIKHKRTSVTIVHKGNIMKFTEGAFKEWGYQVSEEFSDKIVTEGKDNNNNNNNNENNENNNIIIKDRIADAMFQQLLLRPDEYDVIATTNLNGDYLSDACAAQVGGLGLAPGANINYETGIAVFEATHGTAPKYKGLDKVNPGSIILSGVMMLEHLGWHEAAELITNSLQKTIRQRTVTYDLARQMENVVEVKTSEFGRKIVENMVISSMSTMVTDQ